MRLYPARTEMVGAGMQPPNQNLNNSFVDTAIWNDLRDLPLSRNRPLK